ncbi:MAG: 1-phosphofructokinase family hexose kinase [Thermotogaceae bacterium]|nr:1-phosphofructokinase family hexose kinase [Thermotogaceae bacterium]
MIFTLTMNPCLDRYLYIDELKEDDTVRVKRFSDYPAGKGIDVSRVIRELGGVSVAITLLGGSTGRKIEELLDEEGVIYTAIRVEPETRINIILQVGKRQYRLSLPGEPVEKEKLEKVRETLQALIRPGDVVVISGSLPTGVSPDFYTGIIFMLKHWGIKVYFDSDGENLKAGLIAEPDGIKPNIYELSRVVNRKINEEDINEVINAAKEIYDNYKVKEIIVSLGNSGAVLYTKDGVWKVKVPKLPVVSAVGAGDAFLAAYVLKKTEGADCAEALRYAGASGAATVLTPGTQLCRKKDVDALYYRVEVEQIK